MGTRALSPCPTCTTNTVVVHGVVLYDRRYIIAFLFMNAYPERYYYYVPGGATAVALDKPDRGSTGLAGDGENLFLIGRPGYTRQGRSAAAAGGGNTSRLSEASPIIGRSDTRAVVGVVEMGPGDGVREWEIYRSGSVVSTNWFLRHRLENIILSGSRRRRAQWAFGDLWRYVRSRFRGQRVKNNSRKHGCKLILNTF